MPTPSRLSPALAEYLRRLPKVELHNHLEGGSMYPDLALELAAANGLTLPFTDAESAAAFYRFTSLDQFIDILRTTVATLNTAEDYARAVERQGERAAAQNIRYHELFVTYGLVAPRGVPWQAVVEGLEEGRRRNRIRHGVETAFIADIDRTVDPATAIEHVRLAARDRERAGFVGVGLDCQERGFPPGRLRDAFALAKAEGFPLTAHAGEDGGPESVVEALDVCGVQRIDHGVQAIEDPALVERLAREQVTLTVCPVSNIALKVYPSIDAHPFRKLFDAGVRVTVNSDDPPMFATDMVGDLTLVAETFSFGVDELTTIVRNAFASTFRPAGARAAALSAFDAEAALLREQLQL
jgi:adenosine deaminase